MDKYDTQARESDSADHPPSARRGNPEMTRTVEDMEALIRKLEAAPDGSEELDDAIADRVLTYVGDMQVVGTPLSQPTYRHPDGSVGTALRYTRSLDAALTLVPEGLFWRVTNFDERADGAFAEVLNADRPGVCRGAADTPALALCIAALKARVSP
jgi:hypothetical protein